MASHEEGNSKMETEEKHHYLQALSDPLSRKELEMKPVGIFNRSLELRLGGTTIGRIIYWYEPVYLPISWFPVILWTRKIPRFRSKQGTWELRKGHIIRDIPSDKEIGRVEAQDQQKIFFTDGPTYQLATTNFWKNEFTLEAADIGAWAEIKQKVPGLPGALRLTIDPIASQIPNSIQVLLLAGYLIHEHFYWTGND